MSQFSLTNKYISATLLLVLLRRKVIAPVLHRSDLGTEEEAEGVLRLLRFSLQLLASDAQVQTHHFPADFVVLTDEMALDFDNWQGCIGTYWQLTQQATTSLATLDTFFKQMSLPQEAAFWTDTALFTDPRWEEVRTLARAALSLFGWPIEAPPPAYWSGDALVDGI